MSKMNNNSSATESTLRLFKRLNTCIPNNNDVLRRDGSIRVVGVAQTRGRRRPGSGNPAWAGRGGRSSAQRLENSPARTVFASLQLGNHNIILISDLLISVARPGVFDWGSRGVESGEGFPSALEKDLRRYIIIPQRFLPRDAWCICNL